MIKKILNEKIENIKKDIKAFKKELLVLTTTTNARKNKVLIGTIDKQIKFYQIKLLTYVEILTDMVEMERKNKNGQ